MKNQNFFKITFSCRLFVLLLITGIILTTMIPYVSSSSLTLTEEAIQISTYEEDISYL